MVIYKIVRRTVTSLASSSLQIPQPTGLPLIGSTLSLLLSGGAAKLHEYIDKRHKQLGSIFADKIGLNKCIFISDPNDMRKVFIHEGKYPVHIYPEAWRFYNNLKKCDRGIFFMDGQEWLYYRRIMNKLLLQEDIEWFYKPCRYVADDITEIWLRSDYKEIPNLHDVLYQWSVETLCAILLANNYGKNYQKLKLPIIELVHIMQDVFETTSKISLFHPKLAYRLKMSGWKQFEQAIDTALKRANSLSEMMWEMCENSEGLLERLLNEGVSKKDSIRIITDLLLAAGDTTAHTMEWLLYLLAKHPNIQYQLLNEITTISQTLEPSPLLKGVVREALRLYPVAPFLNRILPTSINIKGYEIPPGQLIILSIYTSGRSEEYFKDPERFWPERWYRVDSQESLNYSNLRAAVAHASLPFAMGARSCIGRKLAEAQMYITIGTILNKFSLELLNENNVEMIMKLVAVPSEPIRIALRRR